MRLIQRWLPRFGFSFIIIAAACFWEACKLRNSGGHDTRFLVYCVGGGVSAALGMAGIRARHRAE